MSLSKNVMSMNEVFDESSKEKQMIDRMDPEAAKRRKLNEKKSKHAWIVDNEPAAAIASGPICKTFGPFLQGDKFAKVFKPAALNGNLPGGIFENVVMTKKRYFPLNFPFRHVHGPYKEHQIKKAKDIFKELYSEAEGLVVPPCITETYDHDFYLACPLFSSDNMEIALTRMRMLNVDLQSMVNLFNGTTFAGDNSYLTGKEICIVSRAHNLDRASRLLLNVLNTSPGTPRPEAINLTSEDTPGSILSDISYSTSPAKRFAIEPFGLFNTMNMESEASDVVLLSSSNLDVNQSAGKKSSTKTRRESKEGRKVKAGNDEDTKE